MENWRRRVLAHGAPVTVTFIVLFVVGSLAFWLSGGRGIEALAVDPDALSRPWTLVTFPFAYIGVGGFFELIFFLLMLAWLYYAGGSVEREIGSGAFALVWVGFCLLFSALIVAAMAAMGAQTVVAGPLLPVSAVTVIWAARNPAMRINLYGLIPLSAKILALLVALGVLFQYGFGNPLLGVVAALPLVGAWLYGSDRIPFLPYRREVAKVDKKRRQREEQYLQEVVQRERERVERDRLRDLFERSGIRDEPRD